MSTEYSIKELKIEVTRNCPLWCLHCSSNGAPHAPETLEPSRVAELIREFADLGGEKLCISGGEPLCYEELPVVINACRGANVQAAIYTTGISSSNGRIKPISDRIAALLCENGVKFIFSLHGSIARTHDRLTQVEGSFHTTMVSIEKALKAGATVEVHVVPTVINFQEIAAMTKLLASLNVRRVSWLRFVPQGRGLVNREALQLSEERVWQLAEKKIELQQMCPTVTIRTGAPFNILCPQVPVPCEAAISVLTIGPDGLASPCDAFKQFRTPDEFGSVLHHSLSKVWRKSYLLNAVREIHESSLTSSCASCPLYPQCNSGCIAQKAIASGRLRNGKDPDCLLRHAEVESGEIEAKAFC